MYAWALFAGAGFAALVAASEVAYVVLRIVGAGVLVVLGLRAGRAAWRAGAWFRRARIRARFEAVSGTVLVGLGVRVAVESS